jgi:hypothetical protein
MKNKHNALQEGMLAKLSTILVEIDPDVGYSEWIKALMVIFYETSGSDEGLALANEWSSQGSKYRGFRDIEYRWNHFDITYKNPVRLGTLIQLAKK